MPPGSWVWPSGGTPAFPMPASGTPLRHGARSFDTFGSCGPGYAPAFRPLTVVHALSFREEPEKPTFVVDITPHMEGKLKAIQAYASQFDHAIQAGEVFPGGGRALLDQIRAHAARAGSLIRAE